MTIPDSPDKKPDTAAKPIALKQDGSAWIKVTLPAGKTAKAVEANGTALVWRQLKADTTTPSDPKHILLRRSKWKSRGLSRPNLGQSTYLSSMLRVRALRGRPSPPPVSNAAIKRELSNGQSRQN
jgi:hypothetical protein